MQLISSKKEKEKENEAQSQNTKKFQKLPAKAPQNLNFDKLIS